MKITFQRHGFANNSSSSHSLIFVSDKHAQNICGNEDSEFGWQFFTIIDKKDKERYLFGCLKSCLQQYMQLSYNHDIITYKETEHLINQKLIEYTELLDLDIKYSDFEGINVDHQSVIFFPLYRNKDTINIEFFKEFASYLYTHNFVILGGNDNDGIEHQLIDEDLKEEQKDFKNLWRTLKDIDYPRTTIRAAKDKLTNEWIISRNDGMLLKILF